MGLPNTCGSLLRDRTPRHVPDKILPFSISLVAKGLRGEIFLKSQTWRSGFSLSPFYLLTTWNTDEMHGDSAAIA